MRRLYSAALNNARTMKFLHLNFIPRNTDVALLVLRLWYGLPMLLLHGWGKLTGFSGMSGKFPDPLNVGHSLSLGLTVFNEVVCAALIVLGLFTRVAALVGIIGLGVAFWLVHGHRFSGPGNGELAYIYLGAYVALLFAGAGRYSVDANIGAKS
jgi:putative oxidoreductase